MRRSVRSAPRRRAIRHSHRRRVHSIRSRELEAPDMGIILAITLISLLAFAVGTTIHILTIERGAPRRLTVADIQARLADEARTVASARG